MRSLLIVGDRENQQRNSGVFIHSRVEASVLVWTKYDLWSFRLHEYVTTYARSSGDGLIILVLLVTSVERFCVLDEVAHLVCQEE